MLSGVDEFGLLLFGVELEFGLDVLFGFEEFMSELLELLLELGLVESVLDGVLDVVELADGELLVALDGEVEFMSVLLEPVVVVEDGEVELLEPVWLDEVDGVL